MDFFDYGTESFAKVRAALGIDATDYAASFTAVQSLLSSCANQHERSAGLREIVSSGASGQFFYFTPDRRFVVKTLSRHEKRALLSLAPYYASHCEAHPDTLIRYLGMHSIRLSIRNPRSDSVRVLLSQHCTRESDGRFKTGTRRKV